MMSRVGQDKQVLLAGAGMLALIAVGQPSPATAHLEFEVASIKPSGPTPDGRVTVTMDTSNGGFRATHEPLINLIAFAYKRPAGSDFWRAELARLFSEYVRGRR
jgi:hypothetical protein